MKNILPYIVILLLAGLVWYQCDSAKKSETERLLENSRAQVEIARLGTVAQSAADSIASIRALRVRDSVQASLAQSALNKQITVHKKTIATLRPLVQVHLDTIPDLREFVAQQDSTIAKQDSSIFKLERQIERRSKSFHDEITQQQTITQSEHDKGLVYMEQHLAAQKEVAKEKKKVKLWKIIGGGLAAVIVYLSVK